MWSSKVQRMNAICQILATTARQTAGRETYGFGTRCDAKPFEKIEEDQLLSNMNSLS